MEQIRCPKCGWKGWPVSNSFCYNKIQYSCGSYYLYKNKEFVQSNVCMQNIKK